MGGSSSTANPSSAEQREQESLASASLALPLLRAVFSRSSDLPDTLSLPPASFRSASPSDLPPYFHDLLAALGPTIASLFFPPAGDGDWLAFLRGFNACCARARASLPLAQLLRVYAAACAAAGAPCGVRFEGDVDGDGKLVGELAPGEVAVDIYNVIREWLITQFGRTAAKIASIKGWKDCVEILSPLTAPVAGSAGTDDANCGCALKMQGDGAFRGNDYADALALYTKAMEIDPDDSTLYAKRSLCWLHMSEEDKALVDAYTYRSMKMDLSRSCYEQAAALMLVEEYARACRALVSALKLDLGSDDLD